MDTVTETEALGIRSKNSQAFVRVLLSRSPQFRVNTSPFLRRKHSTSLLSPRQVTENEMYAIFVSVELSKLNLLYKNVNFFAVLLCSVAYFLYLLYTHFNYRHLSDFYWIYLVRFTFGVCRKSAPTNKMDAIRGFFGFKVINYYCHIVADWLGFSGWGFPSEGVESFWPQIFNSHQVHK